MRFSARFHSRSLWFFPQNCEHVELLKTRKRPFGRHFGRMTNRQANRFSAPRLRSCCGTYTPEAGAHYGKSRTVLRVPSRADTVGQTFPSSLPDCRRLSCRWRRGPTTLPHSGSTSAALVRSRLPSRNSCRIQNGSPRCGTFCARDGNRHSTS